MVESSGIPVLTINNVTMGKRYVPAIWLELILMCIKRIRLNAKRAAPKLDFT